MSEMLNTMRVGENSSVPNPSAKPVDFKNLVTGEDHRAPNTGAGVTDAFKNQAGPRGETTNTPEAGA